MSETFTVDPSRLSFGSWDGSNRDPEGEIAASYSADKIAEGKPIRQPKSQVIGPMPTAGPTDSREMRPAP